MNRFCYDCGHDTFESFDGGYERCTVCCELVGPSEKVGLLRALIRRVLYRWHSNTQDAAARGWRS